MSLTKLSLGGNYDVIYKLFPPRESLVSDIPDGDWNIEKLFLSCSLRQGSEGWRSDTLQQAHTQKQINKPEIHKRIPEILRLAIMFVTMICLIYALSSTEMA